MVCFWPHPVLVFILYVVGDIASCLIVGRWLTLPILLSASVLCSLQSHCCIIGEYGVGCVLPVCFILQAAIHNDTGCRCLQIKATANHSSTGISDFTVLLTYLTMSVECDSVNICDTSWHAWTPSSVAR